MEECGRGGECWRDRVFGIHVCTYILYVVQCFDWLVDWLVFTNLL